MVTTTFAQPLHPRYFAVEVSASVQSSPPEIRLIWPVDLEATSYTVRRKSPSDASWGAGTVLPGNATNHADRDVALGSTYEYGITKATGAFYAGFEYICTGINAALADARGKVILIVEKTYAADLASELTRLGRTNFSAHQKDFCGICLGFTLTDSLPGVELAGANRWILILRSTVCKTPAAAHGHAKALGLVRTCCGWSGRHSRAPG